MDRNSTESAHILDEYPDIDRRSCRLLGPTALIVQALMGIMVILSLIYKRHRETPKRPWRIWTFDVSKQIVGQAFVHAVNILVSDVVAHYSSGNPCVLYFLNILIDTTFGVTVIYIVLHTINHLLTGRLHLKGFQSGQYGDPPSILYWARQAAVYVFALTTMKALVVGLFALWPGLFRIGDWLLSWTGGSDAVQVIFVMGIFPIVMNILQFWLIDSIVKASADNLGVALPDHTPRPSADNEPLFNAPESDDDEDHTMPSQGPDIENPPLSSNSHSRLHNAHSFSSAEEQKSSPSGSSTPSQESVHAINHRAIHSYPPSTSMSPVGSYTTARVPSNLLNTSRPPDLKSISCERPPSPLRSQSVPRTALVPNMHVSTCKLPRTSNTSKDPSQSQGSENLEISKETEAWSLSWKNCDNWIERDREDWRWGPTETKTNVVGNIWTPLNYGIGIVS